MEDSKFGFKSILVPFIKTLENQFHKGKFGEQYLCVGIKGERWLVEKEIFEQTYEIVLNPDHLPNAGKMVTAAEFHKMQTTQNLVRYSNGIEGTYALATDYAAYVSSIKSKEAFEAGREEDPLKAIYGQRHWKYPEYEDYEKQTK